MRMWRRPVAELVLNGGIEWNVQPAVPDLDQQQEEPKTVLLGDNRTEHPLGPHCNRTSPAPIQVRVLVLATIRSAASPTLESVSPGFACMHRRSGSGHSLPLHHRQYTCPRRLLTILVEPHAPSTSPWSPPLVLRPISLPTRKVDSQSVIATFDPLRRARLFSASNTLASTL